MLLLLNLYLILLQCLPNKNKKKTLKSVKVKEIKSVSSTVSSWNPMPFDVLRMIAYNSIYKDEFIKLKINAECYMACHLQKNQHIFIEKLIRKYEKHEIILRNLNIEKIFTLMDRNIKINKIYKYNNNGNIKIKNIVLPFKANEFNQAQNLTNSFYDQYCHKNNHIIDIHRDAEYIEEATTYVHLYIINTFSVGNLIAYNMYKTSTKLYLTNDIQTEYINVLQKDLNKTLFNMPHSSNNGDAAISNIDS